jgi:phosphoribosyl 1,2-cyclic phosphodiesterase
MKLFFAGTRGGIEASSPRHRRHSSLVVIHRRRRVVIDCGADWRGRIRRLEPDAIVLTHAHPDHAGGLKDGAPCPVFAAAETWARLIHFPVNDRRLIEPRRPMMILGVQVEAFPVEHSLRAPAVGFKITVGTACAFYAPDVVSIHDRRAALAGVGLYLGDGASVTRALIRKRGGVFIGHASIRTQLAWCAREGVPRALFSHCGSQTVRGPEDVVRRRVRAMGSERGVDADIAHDGLEIEF